MATTPSRSVSDPRTLVTHPEIRSQQSFPFFKTVGEPKKNALERLLSLFADVRAGEGLGALLLTLNVFLILGLYYLLKPAREALVLTEQLFKGVSPPELKAYSSAAQAMLLMGVNTLYGWLAARVPRMRLIAITSVFFAVNLALFCLAGQAVLRIGVAFYVWLGIFNLFMPAQFWAFANDLYTEGQGQRLFPLIGVGASLGALTGASAVKALGRAGSSVPSTTWQPTSTTGSASRGSSRGSSS